MQAPGVIVTARGTGPAKDWCLIYNAFPVAPKANGNRPNKVRCPFCKRRLTPQTVEREPMEPLHRNFNLSEPGFVIPAHKIPKTKRNKARSASSRG